MIFKPFFVNDFYLWFTLAPVNWPKLVAFCRKIHLHSFRHFTFGILHFTLDISNLNLTYLHSFCVQPVPLVHQPYKAGEEEDEEEIEEERNEKY